MSTSLVSSKEILTKTGIKNAKTLTRWHQRGIIPEPILGTHPSGRGKMAFWPNWVLDRCVEVVNLQRQGHSLTSASALIERGNTQKSPTVVKLFQAYGGKGKTAILSELVEKHKRGEKTIFSELLNEDKAFPVVFLSTGEFLLHLIREYVRLVDSPHMTIVVDGRDGYLDALQNAHMPPTGGSIVTTSRKKKKGKSRGKSRAKAIKGKKNEA